MLCLGVQSRATAARSATRICKKRRAPRRPLLPQPFTPRGSTSYKRHATMVARNHIMNRNFVSALFALTLVLPLAGSVAEAQATDPATQNQAQPTPAPRMRDPHTMAVKLGRKLNLTADQTAKLEPILAERQQKLQAHQIQRGAVARGKAPADACHRQNHASGTRRCTDTRPDAADEGDAQGP